MWSFSLNPQSQTSVNYVPTSDTATKMTSKEATTKFKEDTIELLYTFFFHGKKTRVEMKGGMEMEHSLFSLTHDGFDVF